MTLSLFVQSAHTQTGYLIKSGLRHQLPPIFGILLEVLYLLVAMTTLGQTIFLRIGQNAGILLLVNIAGAVMGFLMAAALGRGLGDAGFGQYSFVMTWLLSLMLFTEFGLSTILTRDIAARPEQTPHYLINSLAAKSLLSLPAMVILLFFAPQLTATDNPAVVAALRWGAIFLYSGLVYSSFTAIFRAHQIMAPILWLTLSGQIILLSGTLWLVWQQQPLFLVIAWAGLSQVGQCILAFVFYQNLSQNQFSQITTQFVSGPMIRALLVKAWPFAVAGILAAFQLRANVLILAYLQGDQALGWYAAANRFVETGKQLPAAFYAAMLPAMAAMVGAGSAAQTLALRRTLRQSRLGLLAFGGLASLGAWLLAGPILTLTYGSDYQPATLTLQILTLTLIPSSQNSLLIIYLYACGDEKFVNLLTAAGMAVNLGLCFWLIPGWGPAGVALALLVAESGLYLPYMLRAAKYGNRET
jgi:O-antigen/teichoic acid export membrane protein